MSEINNKQNIGWNILFVAWLLALISTLGSLFFSEIMMFPPCVLCWYQRICMYPLVFILLAGLFPFDKVVLKFSLPLVALGWFISVYHNLLHYGIIPESAAPCVLGASCSTVYVNWFGFVTIPFLSFTSFSILLVLLTLFYRKLYK